MANPEGLNERTLVLVKPDGVKRGLIGEIIQRFEKAGFRVIALKLVEVDKEFAHSHYPNTEDWLKGIGDKTLENYKKYDLDPMKEMGTMDTLEIGKKVSEWNAEFLSSGPIIAMILEGNHAIDNVRMIVGNTLPTFADPGTIRGDFSVDSAALANTQKRAIRNIVHASGEPDEVKREVEHWFGPEDIHPYERADQGAMFPDNS